MCHREEAVRIVTNHLTRVKTGYICVAGVDLTGGSHVRPVIWGQLTTDLLARNDGPFDMAALVDLGPVDRVGHAPEIEDHRFEASRADGVSGQHFWALLTQIARSSLATIFGPDLKSNGNSCAVDLGLGVASLGCLAPTGTGRLYVDGCRNVRLRFRDGVFDITPPVTDIRLYESDHTTPDQAVIAHVARRIRTGVSVILSVGLTRPWAKTGDAVQRHWLQVNNIRLEDNPTWQLG
jgi:hypothetical protein